MQKYVNEIYRRKDLLIYLVISGLKAENRNTFLGYFWWLLDPLLSAGVYYFLIVVILERGGPDFPVFLIIGLVVFRWFRSSFTSSSKSISSKSGIISQVYLPKAIFPVASTMSSLFHFLFGLMVIALFMIYHGVMPGYQIIFLPYIIFIQVLFHLAIAFIMAYICVFIRDIEHITSHFMRVMRYASPVIWEHGRLPVEYRWVVEGNPFSHILIAYRNVLMYHQTPDFIKLTNIGIISIAISIVMLYFYSKSEHKIIKAL